MLGFRALIFLDMDSSEIEIVGIVCVSVGSFPVSTAGQTVFLERLVPTVAERVLISGRLFQSRIVFVETCTLDCYVSYRESFISRPLFKFCFMVN